MSRPRPNNDLWYCLEYNTPSSFSSDDIEDIIAEVSGMNDEFNWWWIIKLKNGSYALLSAWCDYTGWDCQSGIDFERIGTSIYMVTVDAPFKEAWTDRAIRSVLRAQADGILPYGLYDSAYEKIVE